MGMGRGYCISIDSSALLMHFCLCTSSHSGASDYARMLRILHIFDVIDYARMCDDAREISYLNEGGLRGRSPLMGVRGRSPRRNGDEC